MANYKRTFIRGIIKGRSDASPRKVRKAFQLPLATQFHYFSFHPLTSRDEKHSFAKSVTLVLPLKLWFANFLPKYRVGPECSSSEKRVQLINRISSFHCHYEQLIWLIAGTFGYLHTAGWCGWAGGYLLFVVGKLFLNGKFNIRTQIDKMGCVGRASVSFYFHSCIRRTRSSLYGEGIVVKRF